MLRTRRSRTRAVRGRPNYLWLNTAGEYSVIPDATAWDAVIQPGDWSGTVSEQSCVLERIVLSVYAVCFDAVSPPHGQNTALVVGPASNNNGMDSLNISLDTEFAEFFAKFDDVLQLGRLEFTGELSPGYLPVQFSQLPQPVMNLKCRRRLNADDAVWFCTGGVCPDVAIASWNVRWYARSLVRIGLK